MSDTVKKYFEMQDEGLDITSKSRDEQIIELLTKATKAGKLAEVELRCAEIQKEYGSSASLLLGLQLAMDEVLGE